MVNIGNDWDELLLEQFSSDYYKSLRVFLASEYKTKKIYPGMFDIFNALRLTSFEDTKVVLVGQDPYHGAGQAHGLCFSVKKGTPPPPSLVNIFKEMRDDVNIAVPEHGELTSLAKQGVLLLNTVLTVREGAPQSHKGKGWETLTDKIISLLGERDKPTVFILWGANAKAKKELITNPAHLVLTAAHPSPLSAHSGFFGCRHFSKTNEFLIRNGESPIDWAIN